MYTLSKEQKISNYEELLNSLTEKRTELDKQIKGVEAKLRKLKGFSGQASTATDPFLTGTGHLEVKL
jgi:chromosome segregation ATPase